VGWLRREIEGNRTYATAHCFLAAALAQLGRVAEAAAAVADGLALDPTFTVRRYRDSACSDSRTYLAHLARVVDGLRKAAVPEE
jgi:hypothetical protein